MSTTTTPDLTMFCADKPARYKLTEPWSAGGYHYATNGEWAARLKSDEVLPLPDIPVPPMTNLPWEGKHLSTPLPLVSLPTIETEDCEECHGTGLRRCDMEHEHECPDCEGTGQELTNDIQVWWPNATLGFNYVRTLLSRGATLYPSVASRSQTPVRFTIGPIEGLLMQCARNVHCRRHIIVDESGVGRIG